MKRLFLCFSLFLFLGAPLGANAQTLSAAVKSPVDKNLADVFRAKTKAAFTSITPDDSPEAARRTPSGVAAPCDTAALIDFGQNLKGQLSSTDCLLDDGSYADFYVFNGTQGQQITVSLNSTAFDTYLVLGNEDGSFIVEDDDGGGGTNSRITATLPTTGLYVIIANSVFPNQFGDYAVELKSAAPVCTYTLAPAGASVPATGGTFTFMVNTQAGCQWGASTFDNAFIAVSGSGVGSGTVTYTVQVNGNETARAGTIRVGGQNFLVVQAANVCTYSITPSSISIPAARYSGSFTVTTNPGCFWRVNSNDLFISYSTGGGTTGSGTVNYTIATNNGANRTGTITVGGQTFTVNQAGLNCTFSISPLNLTINRLEYKGTISVTTQPGCAWNVSRSTFILIDTIDTTGSGTFSYTVLENVGTVPRTFRIPVFGSGLAATITQTGTSYRARSDFDGDGRADISVFRPSDRVWYVANSGGGVNYTQFGLATDKIVPADYDGDGKTDIAVYRPENGIWFILKSSGGVQYVQYGAAEDFPVPVDFDGNGKAEIAVFRPSTGVWFIYNSDTTQTFAVQFGSAGDIPVAADFNGDSRAEIAVYRPSLGIWFIYDSINRRYDSIKFGTQGDTPVAADYDGDGKIDIAVYRPAEGNWYILGTTVGYTVARFGVSTDLPVPADYDGDGKTDIAVFRPSEGNWYLLQSRAGYNVLRFGLNTDRPTPSDALR